MGLLLCAGANVRAAAPARVESDRDHCGSLAAFERSGEMEDLPGCDGAAPHRTAPVEQALRDAKLTLERAQRQIEAENAERATAALARVQESLEALGRLRVDPAVAAAYTRAAARLRAQGQLLPHLDELRACQTQAQIALRTEREAAKDPPPPAVLPDMPAVKAALGRAEQCAALLQRLLAQRPEDPTWVPEIEVGPGQARRLPELQRDAEAALRAALGRKAAAERELAIVRGRWLRVLFGDRLRVFNAHPEGLPDYDGKARGPLPASVVPRWRYQRPDGKRELYLFRRNKLLSKVVEDTLRS